MRIFRIIFIAIFMLFHQNNSFALSKGLMTKGFASVSAFISYCVIKKIIDYDRRYWLPYKAEEISCMAIIPAISSVIGYGIGYITWYFSPDGRLQRAKDVLNDGYIPDQDILDEIAATNDSSLFRNYVVNKNTKRTVPLVSEFYWYAEAIDNLYQAKELLDMAQTGRFSNKNISDECTLLEPIISNKIKLLKKGMKMLKEEPTWLEMLNAYNTEKANNIQNQLLYEMRLNNFMGRYPIIIQN